MNLYFLVEGRRTERTVYPAWLSHLRPELKKVQFAKDAQENNFYLISGEGYPSVINTHLGNAVKDMNSLPQYNYLFLVLDAEDSGIDSLNTHIDSVMKTQRLELSYARLVRIFQDKCIETWFLGNRKLFVRNPKDQTLKDYISFYNAAELDPELMPKYEGFSNTAKFHQNYLDKIFQEREIHFSKNKPGAVCEKGFLDELIRRSEETDHLKSFQNFIREVRQI